MLPSHRRATAQNFVDITQNFMISMFKLEKNDDFINFPNLLSSFTHLMSLLRDLLAIFLCKIFQSKIVTAQKTPLLQCLDWVYLGRAMERKPQRERTSLNLDIV